MKRTCVDSFCVVWLYLHCGEYLWLFWFPVCCHVGLLTFLLFIHSSPKESYIFFIDFSWWPKVRVREQPLQHATFHDCMLHYRLQLIGVISHESVGYILHHMYLHNFTAGLPSYPHDLPRLFLFWMPPSRIPIKSWQSSFWDQMWNSMSLSFTQ